MSKGLFKEYSEIIYQAYEGEVDINNVCFNCGREISSKSSDCTYCKDKQKVINNQLHIV